MLVIMIPLRSAVLGTISAFHVNTQMMNSRDIRFLHMHVERAIMMAHHLHLFVAHMREAGVLFFQQRKQSGRIESEGFGTLQQSRFRNLRPLYARHQCDRGHDRGHP